MGLPRCGGGRTNFCSVPHVHTRGCHSSADGPDLEKHLANQPWHWVALDYCKYPTIRACEYDSFFVPGSLYHDELAVLIDRRTFKKNGGCHVFAMPAWNLHLAPIMFDPDVEVEVLLWQSFNWPHISLRRGWQHIPPERRDRLSSQLVS